jgi:hypothetical protein
MLFSTLVGSERGLVVAVRLTKAKDKVLYI